MAINSITIKQIKERFFRVLMELESQVKFCKLEKCLIKRSKEKIIIKKGQIVMQALKARTKSCIEYLERR